MSEQSSTGEPGTVRSEGDTPAAPQTEGPSSPGASWLRRTSMRVRIAALAVVAVVVIVPVVVVAVTGSGSPAPT